MVGVGFVVQRHSAAGFIEIAPKKSDLKNTIPIRDQVYESVESSRS
jgi:hypothetical protein